MTEERKSHHSSHHHSSHSRHHHQPHNERDHRVFLFALEDDLSEPGTHVIKTYYQPRHYKFRLVVRSHCIQCDALKRFFTETHRGVVAEVQIRPFEDLDEKEQRTSTCHEVWFYYYVSGLIFLSLLVYIFMGDTKKTSRIDRDWAEAGSM